MKEEEILVDALNVIYKTVKVTDLDIKNELEVMDKLCSLLDEYRIQDVKHLKKIFKAIIKLGDVAMF